MFVVSPAFEMRQILCHNKYLLCMRRKSDQNAGGAKKDKPVEDLGQSY